MNANQSAYPAAYNLMNSGLTKRELIAAMALQGLLANPGLSASPEWFAIQAAWHANALLAKLKETEPK